MRLMLLGINGPFPEPSSACSGYLLQAGNSMIQFDFGTGVLSRLTGLMPPEKLSAIILSHWHYDHTSDLLPLVYRLESMGSKLRILAPVDEASPMRKLILSHSCFELTDLIPGQDAIIGDVRIQTMTGKHPVPCLMFKVMAEGKTFGYTGDTNLLPGLSDFFTGSDLLLADALFTDATWAETKPHLSSRLAARLSVEANAGKVILTHLNPLIDPITLLREAREERKDVILAKPGLSIDL